MSPVCVLDAKYEPRVDGRLENIKPKISTVDPRFIFSMLNFESRAIFNIWNVSLLLNLGFPRVLFTGLYHTELSILVNMLQCG